MTTATWKNNIDGNWAVAADWTPSLPSITTDVLINTANVHTITHSAGADKILSLTVGANDMLAMTGGSLTVLGNSSVHAITQTGGALVFGGVTSTVTGNLAQSPSGTIAVASGVLRITGGSNILEGTLTGTAVEFAGAVTTLAAGLAFTVNRVLVSSGALTLAEDIAESGTWSQTLGTIELNNHKLTLSGTANFTFGTVQDGSIVTTGAISIHTLTLANVSLRNSGRITQSGALTLGSGAVGAILFNTSTGTIALQGPGLIGASTATPLFDNEGVLVKAGGGTAEIDATATNDGTITISSGELRLAHGHDLLGGPLGGHIGGPGTLALLSGIDEVTVGVQLATGSMIIAGATVAIEETLTYAGTWWQTAGTVEAGTHDLTLTGFANFEGGAITGRTLTLMSGAEITSLQAGGGLTLDNQGSIIQNGGWQLGVSALDHAVLKNEAGASFTIATATNINGNADGSTIENAGLLAKTDGGLSVISAASFASTGTIAIDAGILAFSVHGDITLGGTITGAGMLQFNLGDAAFAPGAQLTTGAVTLGSALLDDVAGNMTYAGNWTQTAGTFRFDGNPVLTLAGNANLGAGTIDGPGTLALAGSTVINGLHAGNLLMRNTGTMTETGTWYLGTFAADTATFDNAAGGVFTILGTTILSSFSTVATFTNEGALLKAGGGTAEIGVSTTSTGAITIRSGALEFGGNSNHFGGGIGGAGMLVLNGNTQEFKTGVKLNVAGISLLRGTLALDGALTYAGAWIQTAGTVTLGGKVFNLAGAASLTGGMVNGAGPLVVASTAEIGNLMLSGSMVLDNKGVIVQDGVLNIGAISTDTAILRNEAGATYDITAATNVGANIISSAKNASLVNAGTIEKTDGTGTISVDVVTVNSGLVDVRSGGMTFLKPVSGTGKFMVAAGAALGFGSTVAAGSAVTLGGGAELSVHAASGFGGSIGKFTVGNVIELTGMSYAGAGFSFDAGKLTVTNGAVSVAMQLLGGFTVADFRLVSDNGVAVVLHT